MASSARSSALRLSVLDQSPVSAGSTPSQALANSLDLARHVDRLGYTRLWYSEHHAMELLACTAPEILIARAAAETTRIRVGSGGIMLQHYAPLKVAEVFRTLHAMFPGRIDLGIGRAPGGGHLESYALRRTRSSNIATAVPDDFLQQLAELRAFLHPERFPTDHPFGTIRVAPDAPGTPDVWLLGSSLWSSVIAAQEGLPYAFAHFFSPVATREAITYYQRNFQPAASPSTPSHPGNPPTPGVPSSPTPGPERAVSARLGGTASSSAKVGSQDAGAPGLASETWVPRTAPEATLAIGVICADTDAEAQHLHASVRLMQRRIRMDDRRPVATPDDALRELEALASPLDGLPGLAEISEWPRYLVGTPDRVATQLHNLAEELRLNEIIVNTITHSHQARLHSYSLLAEALQLAN
jgi:alkanesulfonate monooxygenase SsuD/methylene tetrahydromethanopterin reductase-like flavin-dependent oxidoreductase (luciferase family)